MGLSTSSTMVITTNGGSVQRSWNIRVDLIHCGEVFSPPHGCTQYHTGVSGRVSSFNFGLDDDYHHLNDQDYSVCFRKESGHCSISYIAADLEGESFYLSTTPETTGTNSRTGQASCKVDFLTIPRGTSLGAGTQCSKNDGTPAMNFDRFCGRRLNCGSGSSVNSITFSDLLPFHFHVTMNGVDPTTDTNGDAFDNKNRGFSLDYLQTLC